MTGTQGDETAIRRIVETWAIARDSGDFDTLAETFHADGWMVATWFEGPATEFVERGRRAFAAATGMSQHLLGGSRVRIARERAVAQTRMVIQVRGVVHDTLCDVACTGRFFDFFEKRAGGWGIVLRQPIYEKDRLDPVHAGARVALDPDRLGRFPAGYRHLAYLQSSNGQTILPNLPGLRGPEIEALYRLGEDWLAGNTRHPSEGLRHQNS